MANDPVEIIAGEFLELSAEIESKIDNPAPFLRDVGEYMLGSLDIGYQTQTDPSGKPWKPNSPFTIAEKKRRGFINSILQATGAMRSRYNYQVSGSQLVVSNSDQKAPKHQLGIGVPVREHLGIRKEDPANIVDIGVAYISP